MTKSIIVMDFLRDPDQAARRAELEAFIGPNTHKFLPVYDQMRDDLAKTGRLQYHFFRHFCWPVFFGPVWFFYRKTWLTAWGVIGLIIVMNLLPGVGGTAAIVVLGISGRRNYVSHAILQLQKLRRADGSIDPEAIRREGGVSKTAAWISGILYFLVLVTIVQAPSSYR